MTRYRHPATSPLAPSHPTQYSRSCQQDRRM